MRRIGLTGWEIFSKLDAVKWNLNQAEDIFLRVFRLPQSQNQTSEKREIRGI